jgi:CRISPR-associated exonuclease Cas4
MINVSSVSEYIYCPLKAYFTYVKGYEISCEPLLIGKLTHELIKGFNEIIRSNIWSLNKDMSIEEISKAIWSDIPEYIEKCCSKKEYHDIIDSEEIGDVCKHLEDQFRLDSFIYVFKSLKMLEMEMSGDEIVDILFPPSMVEFNLESRAIGLRGKIDRIEIDDGIYLPIMIKTGVPPSKGVWKSHAMQITAYALLMEESFKREVLMGYVDYVQIGTRKAVLINQQLREKFYTIFNEMENMLIDEYVPKANPNKNKCEKCDFEEFCEDSIH